MSNIITTTAGVAARLALAAIMSSIALGAAVVPAKAATERLPTEVSREVSTSGLDLTSVGGRKELARRVALAAHQVCRDVSGPDGDRQACTEDAFRGGMRQVRHLTASAGIAS